MLVQHLAPKAAVGNLLGDDIHISRVLFDPVHTLIRLHRSGVWRCWVHEAGGTVGASQDGVVSVVQILLVGSSQR